MGNLGAGKSKLASLTTASLLTNITDQKLQPFKSGDDPKGITHGVWMCARPLKNPNKKRGSILILDCEGMGGNDVKTNNNLYLFCMIVSSVLAVVLRPARIDREQCDRLYDELCRFQHMQSPCILPSTWLVPLELPILKCNDQVVSSDQWIEKIFTVDESSNNLGTTQQKELQKRYDFIRQTLPNINVANLTYLPHEMKDNTMTLKTMKTTMNSKSSKDYHASLTEMLKKFMDTQGKQLPGSNSIPALMVRPAELALFMSDLIDVINQVKEPNPDELIGRCLLKRFEDEIVKKTEAEFQKEFLNTAMKYAKEKIEKQETNFEPDEISNILQDERHRLIGEYIKKMKTLAADKIYGLNSTLLSSENFEQSVDAAQAKLNSYTDSEELLVKIKHIYKNVQNEEEQTRIISEETDKRLKTIVDRICREEIINQAIDGQELQCELERCRTCHRQAGIVSIIHQCSNGRQGNFYRYDDNRMVCDACRDVTKISVTSIHCTSCNNLRRFKNFIN
ncbi:unnamed protein product [Adineta steineri]|uniref:Guanylate-binding protein N-terminal domain-containing protein n=1 Tax=Adineta steineri TaxID=433720 RepID=A0A815ITE1_9BILA|nr:unnamed protein product [Adineta steineri]CAF1470618.1 unnamed protein product [Adineta steineri]CAF1603800.1 unnamed protein product [Adineta steineri]CAF1635655.1 unnamed protein product [Adineta steineri]